MAVGKVSDVAGDSIGKVKDVAAASIGKINDVGASLGAVAHAKVASRKRQGFVAAIQKNATVHRDIVDLIKHVHPCVAAVVACDINRH